MSLISNTGPEIITMVTKRPSTGSSGPDSDPVRTAAPHTSGEDEVRLQTSAAATLSRGEAAPGSAALHLEKLLEMN